MAHHPAHGSVILPIRGMTCRSCELLLEESLGAVPGVKHVRVRQARGCATILLGDTPVNEALLERAVEEAGYRVGHEHVPWVSRERGVYTNVGIALVVLGVAGLLLMIFNVSLPAFNTTSATLGFPLAVVVGLTAGFSTCMALIGGIVLATSSRFAERHPDLTGWQKFQPHLAFNAGRIVGFALLGGLLGALGSVLQLSDHTVALLTIVVGAVMVLLGIKMTHVSPRLARMTPTLPSWIQWKGRGTASTRPLVAATASGAASFFLPCGFTLAMQLAAINSGSATTGALVMAGFAIGTAPGLLGIGGLTAAVRGRTAQVFFAAAGVLVLGLGLFNIKTSLGAFSFSTPSAGHVITSDSKDSSPPTPTGSEEIRMTQAADGYTPNTLTVHQGSKVRWVINSTSAYTCTSGLRAPSLGISQQLTAGENIIEFIADKAGDIPFSCSMGMYRGTIKVLPKST